jgi:hypothetical protein
MAISSKLYPSTKCRLRVLPAQPTATSLAKPRDNSGRFTKKLSRNQRAKLDIQKFLAREARPGVSKDLELIEHMHKVALECGADNAVGLAKLYEEIQLRGRGKPEETDESKEFQALHPVKFVIVTFPENVQPMPALPAPSPSKPSFVEAEFTTNPALESETHYDQS